MKHRSNSMYIIAPLRKILVFCLILLSVAVLYNILYVDTAFLEEKQKLARKHYQNLVQKIKSKPYKKQKFQRISIQNAGKIELMRLPRIGEKMAERIISYRKVHPFKAISDIKNVKGIGDKTFIKMRKLIKL